jgi:hypothetical protein
MHIYMKLSIHICRAVLGKLSKLMTTLTTRKRHMTGPDANLTKKYLGLLRV